MNATDKCRYIWNLQKQNEKKRIWETKNRNKKLLIKILFLVFWNKKFLNINLICYVIKCILDA